MKVTSTAFNEHEFIPQQYTCKGNDINPPLNIIEVPDNAKSLALIMHDPDALGSDYVHWLMWDISPTVKSISANSVPPGAVQGLNSANKNGYSGPCPPAGSGTHRYMFEFYALDTTLNLPANGTDREKLEEAMRGRILDQYNLTGLVEAS